VASESCFVPTASDAILWVSPMRLTPTPLAMLLTLMVLMVAGTGAASVDVDGTPIGKPRTSAHGWIEYIPGDAPLILAAPHGGALRPAELRDRREGVLLRDSRTKELALELADAFHERTGLRPHVVICHLHRSKLDANRDQGEACQGDPNALEAWHAWHAFLAEAKSAVERQHGTGLFVDVHGQAHPEGWIEWGYALTPEALSQPDEHFHAESLPERSSVHALASRQGGKLGPLLRGTFSLGGLTESLGYPSVPGPQHLHPADGHYFQGGYNTQRHGSRRAGPIDAVQLEVPRKLRSETSRRQRFASDAAECLSSFLEHWYELEPWPKRATVNRETVKLEAVGRETAGGG